MRVSVSSSAAAVVPTAGREPPAPGAEGRGTVAAASVPYSVQLVLSVLHAPLYAELFAFAYLQLWRLLLYRERRLSYQSLCLFLCPVWAALRTKLFSAAFSLSGSLPLLRPPARLHFFPHWLLYCFPSCLQFSTLCWLNLYLAEYRTYHGAFKPVDTAFPGDSEDLQALRFLSVISIVDPWIFIIFRTSVFRMLFHKVFIRPLIYRSWHNNSCRTEMESTF